MYCRKCHHPLEGIVVPDGGPQHRCPECGVEFDPRRPASVRHKPGNAAATTLRWSLLLSAVYAVGWCSIPYVAFLLARLRLGRWPREPQEGFGDALHLSFFLGSLPVPFIALASVTAMVVAMLHRPRGWRRLVLLPMAMWMVVAILLVADPGHVWSWALFNWTMD